MSAEIKIVFTGTVGAGKTTAIASVSDRPPVATDALATDDTGERKPTTTVALDYGEMRLPDGDKLRLYGTPGQRRFRFMWEILAEGALGFVILVDNSRSAPLQDLAGYLDNFRPWIERSAAVVGVTHGECCHGPDLDRYHEFLAEREAAHPVMFTDPRQPRHVLTLMDTLLAALEFSPAAAADGASGS